MITSYADRYGQHKLQNVTAWNYQNSKVETIETIKTWNLKLLNRSAGKIQELLQEQLGTFFLIFLAFDTHTL